MAKIKALSQEIVIPAFAGMTKIRWFDLNQKCSKEALKKLLRQSALSILRFGGAFGLGEAELP